MLPAYLEDLYQLRPLFCGAGFVQEESAGCPDNSGTTGQEHPVCLVQQLHY